jgi:GAF domain-containing protein
MQVPDPIGFDVSIVQRIPVVRTILDVVCDTTGMGFAVVARVTEDRWVACEVRDKINFGIEPGDELVIETTICRDIRQSGQAVAIDEVATDNVYCRHPTPKLYGFQSYISVPLLLPDGSFFGTLCAVDTKPARVNTPAAVGMFKLFAELIGFHLAERYRVAAQTPGRGSADACPGR